MSHSCVWMYFYLLCHALSLWGPSGVHARRHLPQRRENGEDSEGSESVARARCASRCIGLNSGQTSGEQNNVSLDWCRSNDQCATCLEPCKASWEIKKKNSCAQMCQTKFPMMQWECVGSCQFLVSILSVKQGQCPSPDQAQGFEAACVPSCDQDHDCPKSKKCCSNGCGQTCQSPIEPYKGVPLKPRKELLFSEEASGEMEVRWSSRFNVSADPVVYVLQWRWNYGIQPSEDSASSWQEVAQTTGSVVRTSLQPGRWYQFRVASVNSQGTRGFTTPSRHVHSSREPSPPLAPSGLRLSNLTFSPSKTASAEILWDSPEDPDQDSNQDSAVEQGLPVQFYSVAWSWTSDGPRSGTKSRSAERKRRKTVREPSLLLSSLRLNRTYSVEVQAVSFWRQNLLKSAKSIIRFSTHHTPSPPAPSVSPSESFLTIGTPFYQDGQLRVHVYWHKDPLVEFYKIQWGPEHCIHNWTEPMEKTVTKESFTSLSGLLFSCKYRVALQSVARKTGLGSKSESWSKPETTTFSTPSCSAVQAKSQKVIKCSQQTADLSLKKRHQQQQPISEQH